MGGPTWDRGLWERSALSCVFVMFFAAWPRDGQVVAFHSDNVQAAYALTFVCLLYGGVLTILNAALK